MSFPHGDEVRLISYLGISVIEDVLENLVTQGAPMTREHVGKESLSEILSETQVRELWLWCAAEPAFNELLKDAFAQKELEDLKGAMFQHLYRVDFGGRIRT